MVIETAMNVTFPSLMKEFSVSTALVQWITTGYLLVLAVVIPLSGYLKERFLMKRLFLTASGLFILGTLLGAWSPDFLLLLLGRILQGAGTGIALPLMFNIIMDQASLNRLGFMVGAAMLVCALAPAVGPSIGGYIVSLFGWRMIFWAVLPLLLLSFVLGGLSVRQSSDLRRPSFDAMGLLYLAISFTCLLLGCTELGHGSITFTAALLFAGFLLALFFFPESGEEFDGPGETAASEYPGFEKQAFHAGGAGAVAAPVPVSGSGIFAPLFFPDCDRGKCLCRRMHPSARLFAGRPFCSPVGPDL